MRRLIPLTLLALIATLVPAAPAQAGLLPRQVMLQRINIARSAHGLPPFRMSPALVRAAARHSLDMLMRGYFSHTSPTGSTLSSRIASSGFVYGYGWTAGEMLAWGSGSYATPAVVVPEWMASREHRPILLGAYSWVGISRACGTFLGRRGACVWTVDTVRRW
jgi:uncharacterized protein YkwD